MISRRKLLAGTGTALAGGVAVNALSPIVLPGQPAFGANRSYWSLSLPPANPPLARDIDVDVAVIGGGFTGLSAAYALAQTMPKARIAVIEAVRCGNGASGRNGAMMLTSTGDTYLRRDPDAQLDRRLYDLTAGNITRIAQLSASYGMDCELERNGALQVANTPDDAAEMAHTEDALRRAGLPVAFWPAERVQQAIGTSAYHGALYEPGSGQVHPGKLVALWKHAAERAGVAIYEATQVIAIEEGAPIRLHIEGGPTISAAQIVLATNAYTSKLGYLRGIVAPIVNHVAITAPLSAALLSASGWARRIPFNDSRVNVIYAGLTRDGRVHIGGGFEQYQFNNGLGDPRHEEAVGKLRAELEKLFPALAGVAFERSWWGYVDMSMDETPAVGRMGRHDNILYALALSGHGVNLTSVLGQILGDIAAGQVAKWSWFPYLNRLPPYCPNEPFRWLGIETYLAFINGG